MLVESTGPATAAPSAAARASQFQRDGFVRLPRLLDPAELSSLYLQATRCAIRYGPSANIDQRADWRVPRLRFTNGWQVSDGLRRIVLSRSLAELAGQLLGANSVQLYGDVIVVKEPSCPAAAWHCDCAYIPLDPESLMILWFPLQDMPLNLGAVTLRPESHLWERYEGFRPEQPISVRRTQRALDREGFGIDAAPFSLGDAVMYSGRTFHRGEANQTRSPGTAMFIIYMRGDEPLRRPANDAQEAERRTTMPGIAVGKPIHTPMNPVLWIK